MGLRSTDDADYNIYLRVALLSAKENAPSLVPILIYSGAASVTTAWFERQGGTVIFHDVPFYTDLPEIQKPSSGAYLRLEIPNLMSALKPVSTDTESEYVLYTDIDVLFLQNFDSCSIQPKPDILALGAEHQPGTKANTGVMYIRVAALAEHRDRIVEMGKGRNFTPGYDQPLTLAYFAQDQITQLPDKYNWKPYWGEGDGDIAIVHFHGPKPKRGGHLQCLLTHQTAISANCPDMPQAYTALFEFVPDAGRFYNLMLQKVRGLPLEDSVSLAL